MEKTYIKKIYCTPEALKAIEDFEFCGEPIKPSAIEFLTSDPQLLAVHKCPFHIFRANDMCIVYALNETFPMHAELLAFQSDSKWHYALQKHSILVEWNEVKKKKHHRDSITARFF